MQKNKGGKDAKEQKEVQTVDILAVVSSSFPFASVVA